MANGYSGSSLTRGTSLNGGETSNNVQKNISSFSIDTSNMATAITTRKITINGDRNAQFKIIVLQNPASSSAQTLYYNWLTQSFGAGHTSFNNDLTVSIPSNVYNNNIIFPSGGGEFVVKLMPLNGTTIQKLTNKIITKNISKASSNAVVTFTPGTFTTTAANYATLPTSTSTGAVNSSGNFSFNWAVTNSTTDAKSFGFRLLTPTITINDSYWYFQATDTVNGTISSSNTVVVDDITDIIVGMLISEVSAGSLTGTPRVDAIDVVSKTLTLSSSQSFSDGITLYFRAYGSVDIKSAIGLDIEVATTTFEGETITSTLRDDSDGDFTTSTTVRLGATNGISGGNVVKYKGLGVNNASSNLVTSVTPDPDGSDGDGAMVVELTQTLKKGTILTFAGSHKIVNFSGNINILKYPTANRTIHLDLEKIITQGTEDAS